MYYGPWVTEQSQFLTQRRLQITFYLCTCASRSSALPASQIPYCTILYYMVLYSPPFNDIIVLFGQLYSDKCHGDNVRCSWGVGLSRSLLGSGRATIGKRVDAILAQSSFLSLSAALPYVQLFGLPPSLTLCGTPGSFRPGRLTCPGRTVCLSDPRSVSSCMARSWSGKALNGVTACCINPYKLWYTRTQRQGRSNSVFLTWQRGANSFVSERCALLQLLRHFLRL